MYFKKLRKKISFLIHTSLGSETRKFSLVRLDSENQYPYYFDNHEVFQHICTKKKNNQKK